MSSPTKRYNGAISSASFGKINLSPNTELDETAVKNFFLDAMPSDKDGVAVILVRKAYSLFRSIAKKYWSDFEPFIDRVVHDGNIAALFAQYKPTYINLIDDTLFNGDTLFKRIEDLRIFNSVVPRKFYINCYVLCVNQNLLDEEYISKKIEKVQSAETSEHRHLISLKKLGVSNKRGSLIHACAYIDNPMKDTTDDINAFYFGYAASCQKLREFSRRVVEFIHASSVPYVSNCPYYEMSMAEAASILFESPSENERSFCVDDTAFPIESEFIHRELNHVIKDKVQKIDANFDSANVHGVNVFYLLLNRSRLAEFEDVAMLRIYANYKSKQVCVMPYSIITPAVSTITEIANFVSTDSSFAKKVCSFLYCEKPDDPAIALINHKALLRYMHYVRSKLILSDLELNLDDYFCDNNIFETQVYNTDTSCEDLKLLLKSEGGIVDISESSVASVLHYEDSDARNALNVYEIPAYYKEKDFFWKRAFDLFFDGMSNTNKRTGGLLAQTLILQIVEHMKIYYSHFKGSVENTINIAFALLANLCDRGVCIPKIMSFKNNDIIHTGCFKLDGEMTVEALATIPDLFGLPWAIREIKRRNSETRWSEIKSDVFERLRKSIVGIESFLNRLEEAETGAIDDMLDEYIIFPDEKYQYVEWETPAELIYFNGLIDEYAER